MTEYTEKYISERIELVERAYQSAVKIVSVALDTMPAFDPTSLILGLVDRVLEQTDYKLPSTQVVQPVQPPVIVYDKAMFRD